MPAAPSLRVLATAILLLSALTACSSPTDENRTAERQYLAIGDSYTAGYRPALDGEPEQNTTDGFAWKVADETGLSLVNVSCSGITTVDFVRGDPCDEELRAPDALAPVKGSEMAVALDHLDRHAQDVELVTITLGINDLRPCRLDAHWRACVGAVVPRVAEALDELLAELRDRLGPDVPIVGLTYPDVWLGAPVLEPASDDARRIAKASVALFRDVLNPTLERTYADHGARFVDVTDAFGANLPAGREDESERFGTVPARTVRICDETYYCAMGDPHPTPRGHAAIADLVLAARD